MSSSSPQTATHLIKPRTSPPRRTLLAFDFDHTLIAANSDLLPFTSPSLPSAHVLIPKFRELSAQGVGWTEVMYRQLEGVVECEGYSREKVEGVLREVMMDGVLVEGLRRMRNMRAEVGSGKDVEKGGDMERERDRGGRGKYKSVIISDANTVFISEILGANGLEEDVFQKVYTNRGWWEARGEGKEDVLRVEGYQQGLGGRHGCGRGCAVNMCKGEVLKRAIGDVGRGEMGGGKVRVVYVGDGRNDFCPVLGLGVGDEVWAREGFALEKLIKERAAAVEADTVAGEGDLTCQEQRPVLDRVKAKVRLWKTQEHLGRLLSELVGESVPDRSVGSSQEAGCEPSLRQLEEQFAKKATL